MEEKKEKPLHDYPAFSENTPDIISYTSEPVTIE
jgi:hypothetical protein